MFAITLSLLPMLTCQGPAVLPPLPKEWLAIEPVDERGRRPFRQDVVFGQHLLQPGSPPPVEGVKVQGSLGSSHWHPVETNDKDMVVVGRRKGWAYAQTTSQESQVVMVDVQGASTLFVNGDAFAVDVYRYGRRAVPIHLTEGVNHFFVNGIRGDFLFQWDFPGHHLLFAEAQSTVPHLLVGEPVGGEASVALMNASNERIPLVYAVAGGTGPFTRKRSLIPWGLEPLGQTRIPLQLVAREGYSLPETPQTQNLYLSIGGHPGEDPHVHWLKVPMRPAGTTHQRTFRSSIDGTVQKYGLVPPNPNPAWEGERGLVLSLHGASVDAFGLAQCYQPKDEWWIATPTNRAPYGFDWQDWGRRDAYEVRDEVLAMFDLSSQKVCLTGHSMGGHGTWHLAVNDPDSWAGVAPSAGWSSFDSYTGRPEGSLRPLWHGADGASKTMDLLENLRDKPLYLLHGGQDDNVPTQEAIDLASALDELGLKYTMHIEPEAGHWWGNACVDWPGIFETFAGQSVESNPREVDFWSADPGVDAEHHWVRVEQPLEYGRATRVSARRSLDSKHAIISTENVRSVQVRLPLERAIVDGLKIGPIESGPHGVWFVRMPARVEGGEKVPAHWKTFPGGPSVDEKRPECSGPFKRAFDKEFVMVYGTAGTAEETATLLARARFDAGVWFYRANGHGRLCSDQEFLDPEHPEDFSGRNVVLYGNQDTNSAWDSVLDSNAMQVARGRIQWGDSFWEGDDLGAVYVRPRKGEHDTLVGVVASTGVSGARLGYTLSPFISGVGYPDFAVFDASVLTKGDEAILAAGWWNHSWGLGIPDPPREQR